MPDGGETKALGTASRRRRRLPGEALIELEVWFGLIEDVPVQHRLRHIEPIDDALVLEQLQALECERGPSTIAQQPPQTGAIVRTDAHCGIQREAAVLSGEHFADVISLDQPAAGEPAQHPHVYLLGDGDEGLRCQVSGGVKAHGQRDITGILARFEDPVDDAAMTNPPGADLGAR